MVDIKKPIINEEASEPMAPVEGVTPIAPGMNEEVPPVPTGPGAGMSEEEMRADIGSSLSDLKNKRGAMNAQYYVSKNKIEAAKAQMIKSIFDILKDAGVDPTNMESIQAFIQQLEQEDPDLLQLFNVAFDALAGAPEMAPNLGAAKQGAEMPGGEVPPVGTASVMPEMPLPAPPSGPLAGGPGMPSGPGEKFGNVMGAMQK